MQALISVYISILGMQEHNVDNQKADVYPSIAEELLEDHMIVISFQPQISHIFQFCFGAHLWLLFSSESERQYNPESVPSVPNTSKLTNSPQEK